MASSVVPPATRREFRNQVPKADSLRTTRKCSSVGFDGISDRFVMISVSDLNALLMAQSRGARANAAMASSAAWVPTRPTPRRIRLRRYAAVDDDRLSDVVPTRPAPSADELAMVASLLIRRRPHGAASSGTPHPAQA